MTLLLEEHPNQVAEKLTGRDYISWSSVSTFQACPLKWYFRYALGLPEKIVSSSLVFGGAIHHAAEFHYRELLAGNPAPDLDTLHAEYQDGWQERDLDSIKFGTCVHGLHYIGDKLYFGLQLAAPTFCFQSSP